MSCAMQHENNKFFVCEIYHNNGMLNIDGEEIRIFLIDNCVQSIPGNWSVHECTV